MSERVAAVLRALEGAVSARVRDEMGPRFGIVTDKAMGVQMAAMQAIAKPLYPDHALAAALWQTGWYEARMVASMVDDPARVTPEQMDAWRADFDNWGIVDTVCAKLFDRVPCAFAKIDAWATLNDEFGRRAAFALLACCAIHRRGGDADYRRGLALIEAYASDDRNFVRKGVNWALRAIGLKASPALQVAARETAARLAASKDRAARWNGKDALRAFAKAEGKSVASPTVSFPSAPPAAKAGAQPGGHLGIAVPCYAFLMEPKFRPEPLSARKEGGRSGFFHSQWCPLAAHPEWESISHWGIYQFAFATDPDLCFRQGVGAPGGLQVRQVFKRKASAMVAFRSSVAHDLRDGAEKAIVAGRYLIFGGEEEGTATLLLSGDPRLVAVVRKAADEPGHMPSFDVLSVRQAQADIDREREELSQL